jgi:hypothetical protein
MKEVLLLFAEIAKKSGYKNKKVLLVFRKIWEW